MNFFLKTEYIISGKKVIIPNRLKITELIFLILGMLYWFSLPSKIFDKPTSVIMTDKNNELMGALIASDGQWRFPPNEQIPRKFATALITFEDKRFYSHCGIDLFAMGRALFLNLKNLRIVSGGSTLSMQIIRMRQQKKRNILQKIKEMILATRLEIDYSKEQILALYASNAPFGGNVVGLDAASWRYFGRNAQKLSWAESCMLAVLPNAPSIINIGKNRKLLLKKRNLLLKKLKDKKIIDKATYDLSILEPLPEAPKPIPQHLPHLLSNFSMTKRDNNHLKTTIDFKLQKRVQSILNYHYHRLKDNQIYNGAAIVVEVESGNVLAYSGNIPMSEQEKFVDIITSKRSTGSIIKPILYAAMLNSGELLPSSLIYDIPTHFGDFSPENYDVSFNGAVPANSALYRSLNVPFVRMLNDYGINRFYHLLRKIGFSSINKSPNHYGLSLILGGAEVSLWELVGVYASMARTLNNYTKYNGKFSKSDFFEPNYNFEKTNNNTKVKKDLSNSSYFDAASIWLTFKAMLKVVRPGAEEAWQYFSSSKKIAWKTGTSFGFRDAWSIGITPKYVVGVWAGNADGEGRPNLTGVKAAAPILFDIFKELPTTNWFSKPYDDMIEIKICKESGYRASSICPNVDKMLVQKNGVRFDACPFHKMIHLDKTENWQVNSDCESVENMIHKAWFVLPPTVEFYFKRRNSFYKTLPPMRADCDKKDNLKEMEIIYPNKQTKQIYIPLELNGKLGSVIFEAAHRRNDVKIFWHIDNKFIGHTEETHKIGVQISSGLHKLTIVDDKGESITRNFEILDKNNP